MLDVGGVFRGPVAEVVGLSASAPPMANNAIAASTRGPGRAAGLRSSAEETRPGTCATTAITVCESGRTVRTLRHYGLAQPFGRSTGGHRIYSTADVNRLDAVAVLRRMGMSTAHPAASGTPRLIAYPAERTVCTTPSAVSP